MRNPRLLLPLAVLLVVAFEASRLAAQGASPGVDAGQIVLVERNERVESVDLGDPGVSAGDVLAWDPNPFFDAANETATGASVVGECVTVNSDGHQHCTLTLDFPDGSLLTAQGVQQEGLPSIFTITGGTGQYLGATGSVRAEPSADLALFTYTIELGR